MGTTGTTGRPEAVWLCVSRGVKDGCGTVEEGVVGWAEPGSDRRDVVGVCGSEGCANEACFCTGSTCDSVALLLL